MRKIFITDVVAVKQSSASLLLALRLCVSSLAKSILDFANLLEISLAFPVNSIAKKASSFLFASDLPG
jgi:hypothetical protein